MSHRAGRYDLYLQQTPSQTLGPFFHQGLVRTRQFFHDAGPGLDERPLFGNVLAPEGAPGERVRLTGVVYDGLKRPVTDALIEIWQADAEGRYHHPLDARSADGAVDHPFGFGRAATDPRGAFSFETVKPGRVPGLGGAVQAAHLNVIVGARGMTRHAFTRIYFEGDADLEHDPVLSLVPSARRHTLVARARGARSPVASFEHDIHLQGRDETVFFEL